MPEDLTKQEKHVRELAGPNDRWVSVTDASRIARRQEHTIRTWIAQGLLPVHPERVGINKKTRQVRLSDLATFTPIIDPDAGIATDLGTLDLPSIPKQQQQLMTQMAILRQEVAGDLAGLSERLHSLTEQHERFAEEARQTWLVHQQQYQALTRRDDEQQQYLQQLRDHLAEQDTSYSQRLQLIRQDLSTLIAETEQALRQVLADQVRQSEAALRHEVEAVRRASVEATEQARQHITGLEENLTSAVAAHEELVAEMSRLGTRMDQQLSQIASRQESLETLLDQQRDEIQQTTGRINQMEKELLAQISHLGTQVMGLQSTWQERAIAAEQEAQQLRRDLDTQERLQQTLQRQLDEERIAREELARQVSHLLKPSL